MNNKSCNKCTWFESCGDAEVCEYYDPVFQEETDEASILEYNQELKIRQNTYSKIVEEQQS